MLPRRSAFLMVVLVSAGAAAAQTVIRDPVPGTGMWNTVPDGGFETGTMTGWTGGFFTATDAESFRGDFSAVTMTPSVGGGAGYAAISPPITVTSGETYILSAAMHTTGLAAGNLYVDMGDISRDPEIRACIGTSGWQFVWTPWTADRTSIRLRLVRDGAREPSDAGYFDEVALTPLAEFVPPDSTYFCEADCDPTGCPGRLDVFDFLCFQNAFAAGEPYADCDGSGGLDFFDFLCYQDMFAAGCP